MDLMKSISKYRIREVDSGSVERELNRIESEKVMAVNYKAGASNTGFKQLAKTIDVKQFDNQIISNQTAIEAARLSEKYLVVERVCDPILRKFSDTKLLFNEDARVSPIGEDVYLCAFTAETYVGNVPPDIIETADNARDVCDSFEVWRPLSSEEMYGISGEDKSILKMIADPLLIGVTKLGNCLVLGVWDDNDLGD